MPLAPEWSAEAEEVSRRLHHRLLLFTTMVYPLLGLLDKLLYPAVFYEVFRLRMAGTFLLVLLALFRSRKWSGAVLGHSIALIVVASSALMLTYLAESTWIGIMGLTSVFFVAAIILYWDWRHSVVTSVYSAVIIYAVIAQWGDGGILRFPERGGGVLFVVIAAFAVANIIRSSTVSSGIRKSVALEQANKTLQESLRDLKSFKEIQDRDYYLIRELLKPFLNTDFQSGCLTISGLLRQHKSFPFQGRQYDTGGDFILLERIRIGSGSFVFFAIGDAMGKSLQGATGALIFSVVVRSLIRRLKDYPVQYLPQTWLQELHRDLQQTFVTFDDRIYISAAYGVADPGNGSLIFLSEDFPGILELTKNQWLSRIPKPMGPRLELQSDQDSVLHSYRLLPGHSLLFMTDGAEDILPFGSTEVISDREFAGAAALANRDNLNRVYIAILQRGTVIDDMALLSINRNHGQADSASGILRLRQLRKSGDPDAFETALHSILYLSARMIRYAVAALSREGRVTSAEKFRRLLPDSFHQ